LSAAEDDVPEGYFSIPEYRVMTGRHLDTIRAKLKGVRPLVLGRRRLYPAPEALPLIMEAGALALNAEKARLAHERANALAASNQRLGAELVPRAAVGPFLDAVCRKARNRFLRVARDATPDVTAAPTVAAVEAVLRAHLTKAAEELAAANASDLLGDRRRAQPHSL
jgi:hypothetical protein